MLTRLVALDDGLDIPIDRDVVVVGRHPQCDARLDSPRVSRYHCCMTTNRGEVSVRDLGSTNGIRINGHRVESGRLRTGDELSIAHIRYRVDNGQAHDVTLTDTPGRDDRVPAVAHEPVNPFETPHAEAAAWEPDALAAAVRGLLPAGVADRYLIQVIVQAPNEPKVGAHAESE